ncbi:MAG TPA: glycerophosphodiester phosphodiesterase [Pyrinomonadaceae bacterium]|nr:glycerophosphodiester phosphodiesterase [Pyrinomonadaceae bacterium]
MVRGRRAKYFAALMLGGVMLAGALYGAFSLTTGEIAPNHDFFRQGRTGGPLVIAHRGGAGLWPENTLYAFERARRLGVDLIETDVHSTADGVLVVIHDSSLERTTDGNGRVNALSLGELKKLDAGYRWSPDGGRSFPLRGRGITVPTLQEVFAALPEMRFNIEPKQEAPSLAAPLCRMIREHGMSGRVMVGSFRASILEQFRQECPEVATSASTSEVSSFLALQRAGLVNAYSPAMQALQVPEYVGGLSVVTRSFVEAAHGRNLQVHVWTVNETQDMRRMLALGADGIMTDFPDRLMRVLERPVPPPD